MRQCPAWAVPPACRQARGAQLSVGLGLKAEHSVQALQAQAPGLWFEVHAENHMVDGGPRLAWLRALGERHPLSVHGVAMSLAGTEPLEPDHLHRFVRLVREIQPALVSEHLAWSRWQGRYLPDLLPVPRTQALLKRLVDRISKVQDLLGRTLAIENPAHYLHEPLAGWAHEWDEVEFLGELSRRSGCQLLLDLNNLHVSATNLGFDAQAWLDRFPVAQVSELHLAGHSRDPALGAALLIDSHDAPVEAPVWALWQRFVERAGPRPTLIERDANLPAFESLMAERERALKWLGAWA